MADANETELRFGDILYWKVMNIGRRWLSGGRGNGNEGVVTRDGEAGSVDTYYRWSVRETHDDAKPGSRVINYGDYVYLKVQGIANRWLSGGRSNGNEDVITRDGEGWSAPDGYRWRIMKDHDEVGSGPVKYGDTIYLRLKSNSSLFLSGGRGNGNEEVVTRDGEGFTSLNDSYRWQLDPAGPAVMQPLNIKLQNVRGSYDAIYEGPHMCKGVVTLPLTAETIAIAHVQGMARCGGYYLFTHSEKTEETGYIVQVKPGSNNSVGYIRTPNGNGKHPGGIQSVGNFLAVAIENMDATNSWIRFYDCRALSDTARPKLLPVYIRRETQGAGAVGITNYKDPATHEERYLVAVYDGGKIDFYKSKGGLLDTATISFDFFATYDPPRGCCGLNLLTQSDDKIFLITFEVDETANGFTDYAYFWDVALSATAVTATETTRRKMDTQNWINSGELGVHFRYGAGLFIRNENEFDLLASERGMQGNFAFNVFNKP